VTTAGRRLPWDNCRKELFWRLTVDGKPTLARMPAVGGSCVVPDRAVVVRGGVWPARDVSCCPCVGMTLQPSALGMSHNVSACCCPYSMHTLRVTGVF
jgi:hypothetical protein